METQEEKKSDKGYKTFGQRVDAFVDELGEAGERLQKEFHAKYEELKVAADKLKNDADNKEKWKEVENSLKKASDELGNAFKAAFKKRGPEKSDKS